MESDTGSGQGSEQNEQRKEVTKGGKWDQALAVGRSRGNKNISPKVTHEGKWNQASAVGRANTNRGPKVTKRQMESGICSGQGREEIRTETPR